MTYIDLLFSIIYTWYKNKDEIDKDELDEDIEDIISKEIADHGLDDKDIDMVNYNKLVVYLKNSY